MGRIHVLDDAVINKIAAGEVVERPASVVKEMVENALDAGATAISVSLKQGGTASIVVTDNGTGMDRDDAYMALRRHATSKIAAADDLFCIQTMGFRGEALASIAAVSRFSLATVAAGADQGVKLETAGGEPLQEIPWSGPQGTTFAVGELFYNVPARAKFLKAPATELSFCHELMQAFALCHPEVGFTLIHNGKEQLRVPAVSGLAHNSASTGRKGEKALRERASAVFGKDADELMYITAESRYGSLEGLISPPGLEKATGKHLFTFVNGRWVKDKVIRYGVLRGYHSHILKGRFPIASLHLTMDPSLVDVNAHPAKTELRFQYPAEVQNLIALAIRDKIRAGDWAKAPAGLHGVSGAPTSSRRALSPSDDDPGLGILAAAELPPETAVESPQEGPGVGSEGPLGTAGIRGGTSPFGHYAEPSTRGGAVSWSPRDGSGRGRASAPSVSTTTRSYGGTTGRGPSGTDPGLFPVPGALSPSGEMPDLVTDRESLEALLTAPPPLPLSRVATEEIPSQTVWHQKNPLGQMPEVSRDLGYGRTIAFGGAATIPWDELQHVGTFDRCFLMFEHQDKLLVVDQHAFHERILFEKLTRDQSLLSQSQKLLVPEALDMAPSDVAQLMSQRPALVERGFDFDEEGPGTLVVKAVPSILAGRDLVGLFGDLAKGLQVEPGGDEPGDTNAELARLVLATAACHGAVRAGEDLSPQDLKHLIASARDVDFVQNCPHGRRVFRWWTRSQVAGWFDR